MKPDKLLNRNTKSETPTMNAPFSKKLHFDFKVRLVEETNPSDSNVLNHWTGKGLFWMDAVVKANGNGKTQLDNGHRKQRTKRVWNVRATWKLIYGIEESAQLNENRIQDDTIWLHNFTDNVLVTSRQLYYWKVPTTASWSTRSCKELAAPFKTLWTRYESFGKVEVSHELSEPRRNPNAKELRFCGGRSSVTFYKQKQKRNATALQLWRESSDVVTENDV